MECDILMFLHSNPECNTAASLVRICKYTKSHVSTSLKQLEQRGLVVRQQSATNKKHIELHLKKTWYISFGTIMAAGINIVLNYIFVQRYGFVAAAYTTLFCYFVLMILHHFISRYVLKLHLYDDKFMYLSVVVTCIFGIIFMALYNKPWILRWILISVISLGYLWINRKLFKSVISKFASRKR